MKAILIDVSNLANRALHTTGGLVREDGTPIGVIYGILRDVREIERTFRTNTLVFLFDSQESIRKGMYPEYKSKRRKDREAEPIEKKEARKAMYEQVNLLPELLREAGCRNLHRLRGYEADDLIASIVCNDQELEFVIYSSDSDCFQLLQSGRVTQWLPTAKYELTEEEFTEKYKVLPCQWASVKAWAGCPTDNIEGIRGIGEKKAADFLNGKFGKPEIFTDRIDVYNRNHPLVKLPLAGCPVVRLREQVTRIDWTVLERYIDPGYVSITGV